MPSGPCSGKRAPRRAARGDAKRASRRSIDPVHTYSLHNSRETCGRFDAEGVHGRTRTDALRAVLMNGGGGCRYGCRDVQQAGLGAQPARYRQRRQPSAAARAQWLSGMKSGYRNVASKLSGGCGRRGAPGVYGGTCRFLAPAAPGWRLQAF
ncbi:hypothetical protein Xcc3_35530 [Xanthomonas campestris pv. campestris]|nr:hypothetical protein Xcc1_34810 [Xanthomonas campestris pv. campestris]BBK02246.1 hypothetical protein Xcc3_35530 [Xanthomonas campestris pv. campestris]